MNKSEKYKEEQYEAFAPEFVMMRKNASELTLKFNTTGDICYLEKLFERDLAEVQINPPFHCNYGGDKIQFGQKVFIMKINKIQILMMTFVLFCLVGRANEENKHLTAKQKSLVSISSYTAQGKISALSQALNEGLDAGLTINEINETLVQLYAYCGFPRSLNGIGTFMKVLEDRKAKGFTDEQGKEIEMHSQNGDRYEKGRKVLEKLTKMPQQKPAPGFGEFSPRIDAFLKEHLFADIFESDVLTYFQRELITEAALASMSGVGPQLQAHIYFGMNVGITKEQLNEMFDIIEQTVGKEEAKQGREILNKVLSK